jgi:hypothetical protein
MTILTPATASIQGFQVRTRPSSSSSIIGPSTLDLFFVNEDTNQEIHITPVSASYDEYGYLTVSASMFLSGSDFYTLRINQLSASTACTELYRGLVFATEESPVIRNSDPLYSYTGSTTSQALNEFIIWNP